MKLLNIIYILYFSASKIQRQAHPQDHHPMCQHTTHPTFHLRVQLLLTVQVLQHKSLPHHHPPIIQHTTLPTFPQRVRKHPLILPRGKARHHQVSEKIYTLFFCISMTNLLNHTSKRFTFHLTPQSYRDEFTFVLSNLLPILYSHKES